MHTLNIPAALVTTAYSGTSFDPVARGKRAVAGYESTMQSDINAMREHAAKGNTAHLLDEQITRYVAGYTARVVALLRSESRCVSSLIAGPSNFPVRRMQKRSDIAHRRFNDPEEFRRRALKAAERVLRPDLRPIMSGDADAIDRLEAEIASAERAHEQMKSANVAIRKFAKAGMDHQVAALMEQGFTEAMAREILKPDFMGRVGFPGYALSNSTANIRRMKQRLETLQHCKAQPVTEVQSASGVRLEDDPPANRVRLFFPGKPDVATRERLKKQGFRWSPSIGAWQAYRNHWSMALAHELAPE